MNKTILAAAVVAVFAAAPATAGNYSAPVMDPVLIETEAASSSVNQAEMVAFTLTTLILLTALITAN